MQTAVFVKMEISMFHEKKTKQFDDLLVDFDEKESTSRVKS